MTGKEDFLSRWARRKAEARAEDEARPAEPRPPEPDAAPAASVEPVQPSAPAEDRPPDMLRDDPPDEETRAQWVEKLEAVDLETLTYQDDFTVFMKSWVPRTLRNRALKRLWLTDDVFAVLDGLNDYDEDYSVPAAAVGDIKSDWKLGRGFSHDEDVEAETETETEVGAEAEAEAGEASEAPSGEAEADEGEEAGGADDSSADDRAGIASGTEAEPAGSDENETNG